MTRDNRYQQLNQISTATVLEESTHLKIIMRGIITLSVLVGALILWSAFTYIQETAITYGEIMPKGHVNLIQHLEGGIVSRVLVENGDSVKKGQLLIRLDEKGSLAELEQLRSREVTLTIDSERLRALLANKPADLVEWSKAVIDSRYNTIKNHEQVKKLLVDEQAHLESQYQYRDAQRKTLQSSITRKEEQLKEARNQLAVWEAHIELLTKEYNMYTQLHDKNLISQKDYLGVLREMNKARGEREKLKSQIIQLSEAIIEANSKSQEVSSAGRENTRRDLGKVSDTLLEVRHKIEKIEDRLLRANVISPSDGIIKGLKVAPGNVIQPGAELLEVIPYDQEYVAETRINPRDIGHIKAGDDAKVKVLTYDFARFGGIKGKIAKISASTFFTDDGKPYYKATITLDNQYVTRGGKKYHLKTGMTAQADIMTGEKTLLQYILKPIHQSATTAFTER